MENAAWKQLMARAGGVLALVGRREEAEGAVSRSAELVFPCPERFFLIEQLLCIASGSALPTIPSTLEGVHKRAVELGFCDEADADIIKGGRRDDSDAAAAFFTELIEVAECSADAQVGATGGGNSASGKGGDGQLLHALLAQHRAALFNESATLTVFSREQYQQLSDLLKAQPGSQDGGQEPERSIAALAKANATASLLRGQLEEMVQDVPSIAKVDCGWEEKLRLLLAYSVGEKSDLTLALRQYHEAATQFATCYERDLRPWLEKITLPKESGIGEQVERLTPLLAPVLSVLSSAREIERGMEALGHLRLQAETLVEARDPMEKDANKLQRTIRVLEAGLAREQTSS